jgi:hypothetical protein
MLRRVALVRTDVSEELSASIIRVTRIGELGTRLATTSNRCRLRRISSISIAGRGGGGLMVCKRSRISHLLDNRLTDNGEVFSLTVWQCLIHHTVSLPFLALVSVSQNEFCGYIAAGRMGQMERNAMTSLGFDPATFGLVT